MPGNYLGTMLDHVNSCRTWRELREGGKEGVKKVVVGGVEIGAHKQEEEEKKSRGTKTKRICICLPAKFSASIYNK